MWQILGPRYPQGTLEIHQGLNLLSNRAKTAPHKYPCEKIAGRHGLAKLKTGWPGRGKRSFFSLGLHKILGNSVNLGYGKLNCFVL